MLPHNAQVQLQANQIEAAAQPPQSLARLSTATFVMPQGRDAGVVALARMSDMTYIASNEPE